MTDQPSLAEKLAGPRKIYEGLVEGQFVGMERDAWDSLQTKTLFAIAETLEAMAKDLRAIREAVERDAS